jgi:tRNA 5-methylaminomethyl-2-thiouridine biosynthesis bifunctional protein
MSKSASDLSVIKTAKIEWNKGQPYSKQFDDLYFSRENGLAETSHVFIHGNQLPERWQQLANNHNHLYFSIGETGFGTGLNFIATWQAWNNFLDENGLSGHLFYYATELHPLEHSDMKKAAAYWPELIHLYQPLLDRYPELLTGMHTIELENLTLTLVLDECGNALDQLTASEHPALTTSATTCMDAWFLDGFAPSRNSEMWREEIYPKLARLSKPGTTVATFTAAGDVRRGLESAGFKVSKTPGFGHKREKRTNL